MEISAEAKIGNASLFDRQSPPEGAPPGPGVVWTTEEKCNSCGYRRTAVEETHLPVRRERRERRGRGFSAAAELSTVTVLN